MPTPICAEAGAASARHTASAKSTGRITRIIFVIFILAHLSGRSSRAVRMRENRHCAPDIEIPIGRIAGHAISQDFHFDSRRAEGREESESANRVINSGGQRLYQMEHVKSRERFARAICHALLAFLLRGGAVNHRLQLTDVRIEVPNAAQNNIDRFVRIPRLQREIEGGEDVVCLVRAP